MDHHLKPLNKQLPSYVQDTTDLIKKLEALPDDPREDTILVTMDVRSLYTNIPNEEGKEAIKSFFTARSKQGDDMLSKVIYVFLTLILTLITSYSTTKTTCRSMAAAWARSVPLHKPRYTWGV